MANGTSLADNWKIIFMVKITWLHKGGADISLSPCQESREDFMTATSEDSPRDANHHGEPQKQRGRPAAHRNTHWLVRSESYGPMDQISNISKWWREQKRGDKRNSSWPQVTASSVKHGGGSVLASGCMASIGTGIYWWMQRCAGAACAHIDQNSPDNISSLSQVTILKLLLAKISHCCWLLNTEQKIWVSSSSEQNFHLPLWIL